MTDLAWALFFVVDAISFALAVYRFTHKQWLAGMFLAFIGLAALGMSVWSLRTAARLNVPLDPVDSSGRIVMQAAGSQLYGTLIWAVGFLVVAVGLADNPELLRTRWLGYPAAVIALALCGAVLYQTPTQRAQRYVADSHGFDTGEQFPNTLDQRTAARLKAKLDWTARIEWSQVGGVKRVRARVTGTTSRNSTNRPTPRRYLVFFGRDGKELLRIDDQLDPPERYKLFLESIPRWTGLQIQEASE